MIDARAIVDNQAELEENVTIGPFSIIGPHVKIGAGTWIGPHVVIKGPTTIGKNNRIYQFSSLGEIPQDKKYQGEDQSYLVIGDHNEIREYCTMSRGTVQGGHYTQVGSHNWIMAYTHIAHDCRVGDHTVFANGASLAGHVTVEDYAILGGFSGVHQFCRVGTHSFIAAGSIVFKDVPPYVMASGNPAQPHGLNREGLKRRGFSEETVRQLRQAYKTIYKNNLTVKAAMEILQPQAETLPELALLLQFLDSSSRGIVR